MSSIYTGNSLKFGAQNGVDGFIDSDVTHGKCTHTDDPRGSTPWWMVDLGSVHMVYNLTVYPRAGECCEYYFFVRLEQYTHF